MTARFTASLTATIKSPAAEVSDLQCMSPKVAHGVISCDAARRPADAELGGSDTSKKLFDLAFEIVGPIREPGRPTGNFIDGGHALLR